MKHVPNTFHPCRYPSTGWRCHSTCGAITPPVPFCTRVSARLQRWQGSLGNKEGAHLHGEVAELVLLSDRTLVALHDHLDRLSDMDCPCYAVLCMQRLHIM